MKTIPGHPHFDRNSEKCTEDQEPCYYCGKPLTLQDDLAVHIIGGGYYAENENEFVTREDDSTDMGYFGVGKTCAKNLKSLGVYVGQIPR